MDKTSGLFRVVFRGADGKMVDVTPPMVLDTAREFATLHVGLQTIVEVVSEEVYQDNQ